MPDLGLKAPQQDFKSFVSGLGLQTPEQYTKEATANIESEKAERAPLLENTKKSIERMHELALQLGKKEAPKEPDLKDIPNVPDAQYKDPTQALGSMMSVLAMLGSLKTRAPLTAALNSGAAAIEAFHQGDQDAVKLERQKWHDNLEKGLQQNQIEMEKYSNALQKAKFDFDKVRPEFEALAAEEKWDQMLVALNHGDHEQVAQLIEGRNKAALALVTLDLKDKQFRLSKQLSAQQHADTAAATAAYRESTLENSKERLRIERDKMEEKAAEKAAKVVEAGKPTDRALEVIGEMEGILQSNFGVTGAAAYGRRPLESLSSLFTGSSGSAHQYESLARELQNILRQTSEFRYKGRTLSKEVADRDVMVRGLKFGDTGQISMDQLQHLRNMLTGGGASFEGAGSAAPMPDGLEYKGYKFPNQDALDKFKAAGG